MTERGARIAAFFDFDRTLIDTDGGVQFGKELIRYYRRRVLADRPGTLGWLYRVTAYHLRLARILLFSYAARLLYYARLLKRSALVNLAYSTMKGLSENELRLLSRDFVDEVLIRHVYPDAERRLRNHRAQGHLNIIVTTNMRLLVEHFKRHLPIDDVIGIELEAKDGRFTGRVRGPTYGAEKAQVIRDYAHARNISLPRSHAYTDHYSDHYLLPLVGHPFAVNPGWRLLRLARRRRWGILRFAHAPKPGGT